MDVAIVNYNTCDELRKCLATVSVGPVDRVLVADNGSTDGSLEMVQRDFPDVTTISLPHNPGYGAAANELVALSNADVVLLLNADVRIAGADMATLIAHMHRHPRAAVVGPQLRNGDGVVQRSQFEEPSIGELLRRESGLGRRFPGPDRSKPVEGEATTRSVLWLLGAAMAIRREAFLEVGGFDPGYFLYFEEVDLCLRLRGAGWTVHLQSGAVATHLGGASANREPGRTQRALYRSLDRYHSLHTSTPRVALRFTVASIMVARLVRDGVLGLPSGRSGRGRRRATRIWWSVMLDAIRGWPDGVADGPVTA